MKYFIHFWYLIYLFFYEYIEFNQLLQYTVPSTCLALGAHEYRGIIPYH